MEFAKISLNCILNVCKKTGGYIYQAVSEEFPLAATCSEKEHTRKKFPFIATSN